MIAPLSRSTVRGAIWYQGEANIFKHPEFYACHITAMVQDWKNTFPHGNTNADNDVAFPFGIVQVCYFILQTFVESKTEEL
jgi:sialate O-acetylesterase